MYLQHRDEAGHLWETIWNDQANSEFEKSTVGPECAPARRPAVYSGTPTQAAGARASGAAHMFQMKGVPAKLRLRFLTNGEPRAKEKFTVVVDDLRVGQGNLDDDGRLEVSIAPVAQIAVVAPSNGAYLELVKSTESQSGALKCQTRIESSASFVNCPARSITPTSSAGRRGPPASRPPKPQRAVKEGNLWATVARV